MRLSCQCCTMSPMLHPAHQSKKLRVIRAHLAPETPPSLRCVMGRLILTSSSGIQLGSKFARPHCSASEECIIIGQSQWHWSIAGWYH
jgi:hypothetical protein